MTRGLGNLVTTAVNVSVESVAVPGLESSAAAVRA